MALDGHKVQILFALGVFVCLPFSVGNLCDYNLNFVTTAWYGVINLSRYCSRRYLFMYFIVQYL